MLNCLQTVCLDPTPLPWYALSAKSSDEKIATELAASASGYVLGQGNHLTIFVPGFQEVRPGDIKPCHVLLVPNGPELSSFQTFGVPR